jgi:drug/metabolite transporter (DMT)-like permease
MKNSLFYLATVLIWGTSWFAITFQLGDIDPTVSVFYRFFFAGLAVLAFCAVTGRRLRFSIFEHAYIALQGLCLFCVNYILIYWATSHISSGLVAVIFSTLVIMNIFNGALFLKRPIRRVVVLGALLGLIGITLVFWQELQLAQQLLNSDEVWIALVLVLLATFSASIGNILSARNQEQNLPVLQTNGFGTLYGSIIMMLYAMSTGADFFNAWSLQYTMSMAYLTVFGTIVAFGAYLSLVGQIGADKAAYAMVLFPLVALVISTVFEGFVWTPVALFGVALILIGNAVVIGRKQFDLFLSSLLRR